MEENESVTLHKFTLVAFSRVTYINISIFIGILIMYLLVVLGNLAIATLICLVYKLHTPMYFFLCNLAVQDIVYVSTTMPKLMDIIATGDNGISFAGCITQIFVFDFCVLTEFYLLVTMAYDRYVAICLPLRYSLIMEKRACALMALASWVAGAINSMLFTLLISNLSFCKLREINHFFCDPESLMKLSCSDTTTILNIVFVEGIVFCFLLSIILTSYAFIISTILKIQTSAGKQKAFSRCSSHLTTVILFFGTAISLYLKPEAEYSPELDKLLSLLYVVLVPLLNPIVYSFRNKQVWMSAKEFFDKFSK
ncbi:hypothetical protein GDO86_006784 [Hymenochirus boettgeri]|uniref:Olfactory receptor n=1 Tax=Hymenochirus boettgeri TaxID=247094 RepID=A0A8T2JF07_9PIPI|nr:hypothetical protein GDO86_006784 [Hymenochirus boettgeri]